MAFRNQNTGESDFDYQQDKANTEWYEQQQNNKGNQGGNLLMGILYFGPVVAGWLSKIIWGIALKIGVVGRVLTTAIVVFVSPLLVGLPLQLGSTGAHTKEKVIDFVNIGEFGSVLMIGVMWVFIPLVYFLWHWNTIKEMGAYEFGETVQSATKPLWFGTLGVTVVSIFKPSVILGFIGFGVALGGYIYYFIKTRPYAKAFKKNNSTRFNGLKMIITLIGGGLVIFMPFYDAVENKAENAVLLNYFAKGNTVVVSVKDGIDLKKEHKDDTKLLKLPRGAKLTIIDYVDSDIQVEYNGVKGWFPSLWAFPVAGTATLLDDAYIGDNDNILVKKGETVSIGRLIEGSKNGLKNKKLNRYEVMDNNGNFGKVLVTNLTINK